MTLLSELTDVPVSNPTTEGITERALQSYICQRLSQSRIDYKTEVIYPGTDKKADVVTNNTIIEVKKYLTCDAIRQAYSQDELYQKLLVKPRAILMGLSHPDAAMTEEALALKKDIDPKVLTVVFIDRDPRWSLNSAPSAIEELEGNEFNSFFGLQSNPLSWIRIIVICLTLIGITIVSDKSPEKQWQYYNNAVKALKSHNYDDAATNFAGLQSASEGPCIQKYAAAMKRASQEARDAISQGRDAAAASQIFSFYQEKAIRGFTASKCRMPKLGE